MRILGIRAFERSWGGRGQGVKEAIALGITYEESLTYERKSPIFIHCDQFLLFESHQFKLHKPKREDHIIYTEDGSVLL